MTKTTPIRNTATPIRNSRIKRDFKRLLALLAGANLANVDEYAEVEAIAQRNGLYFDDDGQVREIRANGGSR